MQRIITPRRISVLILLISLLCGVSITRAAAPTKPNIVFILADDLGWTDLGCFGSHYYLTPHIDRLCSEGEKFMCAYMCPNCAPTRAELMSGQYPPRTGIYTVGSGARGKAKFRKLDPVKNNTTLSPSVYTVAEALHAAGYTTASMGKWHLGEPGFAGPREQGFDVNVAGNHSGHPVGGYFSPYHNPQLPDGPKGEYLTDRLTDEAVKFIEAHRDGPFFLYFPHYAVHTPLQAKADLIAKYKDRAPSNGQHNPTYAAMIDSLDQSVGRIMATLDRLHIVDNTVVIFASDNGGVGGYAEAGVKGAHEVTDNRPLHGGKGMLYEGGVRVPMMVRWPGVTTAGSQCNTPIDAVDFYPTFLDITGAKAKPGQPLDGVSFLPLLHNPHAKLPRDAIYWHFPGYLEANSRMGTWRTTPGGAIRSGEWKLIQFFNDNHVELYNLADDLGERHDEAKQYPDIAARLLNQLTTWRHNIHAPMPQPK